VSFGLIARKILPGTGMAEMLLIHSWAN